MRLADLRTPNLDPRDIDQIAAHVTGRDLAWVLAHPEHELTDAQAQVAHDLIKRRRRHEPLAYLLGVQPFYGRDFAVSAAVLIPRPESELMIDDLKQRHAANEPLTLVDVGTGSGALAITAALEFSAALVTGIDISPAALAVAAENAKRLAARNVDWLQGDLLAPAAKAGLKADVILANLPYLPAEEIAESPTSAELAYEPQTAFLADDGGLALIKQCIIQAQSILKTGGDMYLEMLPGQIPLLALWLGLQRLPYASEILVDLSGQNRILRLTKV